MQDYTKWILVGITVAIILMWLYYKISFNKDISSNKQDLQHLMDRLWSEHVIWTRLYIIAALNNITSKNRAAERLMLNQEEIGNAIGTLYGKEAGNKLTELLKSHISIATSLIEAIQSSNDNMLNLADRAWIKNADEIAVFLSSANPYIPEADMKKMMRDHLHHTKKEVYAQFRQDWDADVQAFDIVMKQIMEMSKNLTNALSAHLNIN